MTDTNTNHENMEPARNRVGAIAALLDGYKPFSEHMEESIKAKAVMQYSSIQAFLDLEDAVGEDELKTWPIIGTEAEKGHNNPDKYSVWVKVGDEKKERKTDFVKEIVQHIGKGRELQAIIDAVTEAKGDPTKTSHPVISKMRRPEEMRAAKADAEMELSVYRGNLRNGLRLWQKIWEFDNLPNLTHSFLREIILETYYVNDQGHEVSATTKGSSLMRRPVLVDNPDKPGEKMQATRIRRTPKPVKISDANDPAAFTIMSVGSFLNINVDDIRLAGGTYEGFLATRKRDRKEEEIPAEGQNVIVNTLATFETATAGINNWLDQEVNVELLQKKFRNAIKSKKIDDVAALAESIREIHIHTKALFDLSGTILEMQSNGNGAAKSDAA